MPGPTTVDASDAHPNVILIMTDDQGWGDLSCNGNTNLKTPHIDSLAESGATFKHFYVAPVCSPTRAEMLTGRYHTRTGVSSTSQGGERIHADETTIAEVFKAAGYVTGIFGKWHNGSQWPYHPNARGFDEFYGFTSGHWGNYFEAEMEHNSQFVQGEGYIVDDLTNRALEFISNNQEVPFFCFIPYNTPHTPMQMPDAYWDSFKNAELEMRHREPEKENIEFTRAALAMCENIDWNVGRILETLDALKLTEDTLVLFMSDNGPNSWRWNGGMRGKKGSTDEGGVRSPLFVQWSGTIPANSQISEIAGAIDLLPTLVDLTGLPLTALKPMDGISLKPLLLGEAHPPAAYDRLIFSAWQNRVSVRNPRYRLDHQGQLYDIEKDPEQRHDISEDLPELSLQLRQAVRAWQEEARSPSSEGKPFTVGHPGQTTTHLPARDGEPEGGVTRSSRWPNCSFFTNWKSTEDAITWDIQVLTPGDYQAEIYYTCPDANTGLVMELSFKESKVIAAINEAHDPPLIGEAANRVPGSESYVKRFKSKVLGTLKLPAETSQLRLRAIEIPGDGAIDMRRLILTRLDPK